MEFQNRVFHIIVFVIMLLIITEGHPISGVSPQNIVFLQQNSMSNKTVQPNQNQLISSVQDQKKSKHFIKYNNKSISKREATMFAKTHNPIVYNSQGNANVLFPDEVEEDYLHYDDYMLADLTTKIGTQCAEQGQTYCEDVEQYPSDLIAAIMDQSENQKLFNDSIAESSIQISSRLNNNGNQRLCKSKRALIYPKLAMSVENRWKYVINQGQHQQGIKVDLCDGVHQCAISHIFPNGWISQCTQMFTEHLLLSIDPEHGRAVQNLFRMPSHCECTFNLESS